MLKSNVKSKIFIIFVLLLLCASQLSAAPCGDVNSDNIVNIVDALLIAKAYVEHSSLSMATADVNGDRNINIVDALLVAQYYVKMISKLSGCRETITQAPTPRPTQKPTPDIKPQPQKGLIGWATENGGTTGGQGGSKVRVTSHGALKSAVSGSGRKIIEVSGSLSGSGMLSVGSNKTIIGVGSNAKITGFGLNISGQKNVIIQNISFTKAGDDSINIQSGSTNVWVDHCSFSSGKDGLLDIKRGSSFITVSWNHFSNHHKTCLLGHSNNNGSQDKGKLKVSYHHNYFESNSRNPRVRFGYAHVFNNYYNKCSGYGVASTCEADVLVEGNYFEGVKKPCLVGYASSGPGDLVERNNVYKSSGKPQTRGSVASIPYSYKLDNAQNIPSIVRSGAGAGKL